MKNALKICYCGLLVALFLFCLTGCGKKEQVKSESSEPTKNIIVGFAQLGSESAWRNANTKSVKEAAKEAGITLIFRNAENNMEEQLKSIREFIMQQVDVIVLPPLVTEGWDEVLNEAKQANIPVIICDREIETDDPSLYVTFLGSDFVSEGVKAAEWLINATKDSNKTYNIVEIEGNVGSTPAIDRKKGFNSTVLKHPRFKILESTTGDFIRAKGRDIMNDMLKKYGNEIDVLFSHNDEMALGAIEAIEAYGLKPGKDILILSIDGQKEALEQIIAGKINVSVECNPLFGHDLMNAVKDLTSGKTLPRRIITKDNVFTIENAEKELPNREY